MPDSSRGTVHQLFFLGLPVCGNQVLCVSAPVERVGIFCHEPVLEEINVYVQPII